ncbi:Acylphosphatase [Lachnellula hyalina]|uniref:acylphosphatase n=1 Tax=Lachnellula hyalina TaxID=1316788 RepID=A0A8H8TYC4_9HELO|nr:Acylphosphatase [Lachnellula hyalina]TVY24772.1 Acylphosphatase [Lachnellula hyalina]
MLYGYAGVGFRYFTRKRATAYNLTGWVKNVPNNKVEGEAQGEEGDIEKLLKDLDRGPSHSEVVKVEREEVDVKEGESAFMVK